MVAAATILGTVILSLFPHSMAAWFLWATAVVLLGMTVYAALGLREEVVASPRRGRGRGSGRHPPPRGRRPNPRSESGEARGENRSLFPACPTLVTPAWS